MRLTYPIQCLGVPGEGQTGSLTLVPIVLYEPKPNELLVKVKAIGVNRADLEQALGNYPPPKGSSNILGLELSGEIIDVGDNVTQFKPGDSVMSLVTGGAYAEFACVPEETSLLIPDRLSYEQAAAIPEAYFTIWYNVFIKGHLKSGEYFLVHGGVSGVGSAAVQLAKAAGAVVIATVGSDEKIAACQSLGADYVINYKKQNFKETILSLTENDGVDVIFDWIGAEYLDNHLQLLRNLGRLIVIDSHYSQASLNFDLLLSKSLTITGSVLRPLSLKQKADLANGIKSNLLPKLISGEIKPLIYTSIPLDKTQMAHDILKNSSHVGKVILTVDQL